MTKEELIQYLKDNLEIEVKVDVDNSERDTGVKVEVELYLDGELITSADDDDGF